MQNMITVAADAPVVMEKCALEAIAPFVLGPEDMKGLYFGAYPNSHIEYYGMPASVRLRSAFSMEFKTTEPNGVLFYFADKYDYDHLSLIIKDGKIRYTFNSGTGLGEIVSTDSYNDGTWHMLEFGRSMKDGTLQIDGQVVATVISRGRARSINGRSPYYFGGVNENYITHLGRRNLEGVLESFKGCIANIKLNKKDIGEPVVRNGTIPCSDLTEVGAYFFDNGGYISLEMIDFGRDLKIELEIRPRSVNGVIFSFNDKRGDVVLIHLIEGKLHFSVENGAGAVIADNVPDQTKLCDGMWHKIIALKNKNVVSLAVDNYEPIKTVGVPDIVADDDTELPLYIGGQSTDAIIKGVRAKGIYQGCIRNVRVNGELKHLTTGVVYGNVAVEMCPIN